MIVVRKAAFCRSCGIYDYETVNEKLKVVGEFELSGKKFYRVFSSSEDRVFAILATNVIPYGERWKEPN